ncbi:hypothetical protein AAMO2058_000143900 [Amorphochlora amoebiformis]
MKPPGATKDGISTTDGSKALLQSAERPIRCASQGQNQNQRPAHSSSESKAVRDFDKPANYTPIGTTLTIFDEVEIPVKSPPTPCTFKMDISPATIEHGGNQRNLSDFPHVKDSLKRIDEDAKEAKGKNTLPSPVAVKQLKSGWHGKSPRSESHPNSIRHRSKSSLLPREESGFERRYRLDRVSAGGSTLNLFGKKKADVEIVQWEYCIVIKDFLKANVSKEANEQERQLRSLLVDIQRHFENIVVVRPTEKTDRILYILIAATNNELQRIAKHMKPWMLLDPEKAYRKAFDLKLPLAAHYKADSSVWKNLFAPYSYKNREMFAKSIEGGRRRGEQNVLWKSDFRAVERIYMIYHILFELGYNTKNNFHARYEKVFVSSFPLHCKLHSRSVLKECLEGAHKLQTPIEGIEEYLGPRLALYFDLLVMYTWWLVAPAILGLGLYIYQSVVGSSNTVPTILYALLIIFIAMILQRRLLSRQYNRSLEWGTAKMENLERDRNEYKGRQKVSEVDGRMLLEASRTSIIIRMMITLSACMIILLFIFSLAYVSFYINTRVVNGTVFVGIADAVLIKFANIVNPYFAQKLTDFENVSTRLKYENKLIAKLCLFKFFTGYGSLFYSAFFQHYAEGECRQGDCGKTTAALLRGIFFGILIINNVQEVVIPWISKKASQCRAESGADGKAVESEFEAQYRSPKYEGALEDYDEIVTQFGYAFFFVPLFPLAPCLALLNNMLEIRIDSYKMLKLCRRPIPHYDNTIGMWNKVIAIYAYIAIVTNIALLIFHYDIGKHIVGSDFKIQSFLIAMIVFMFLKFGVDMVTPIKTNRARLHAKRWEYLWPYLIDEKKPEEDHTLSLGFSSKAIMQKLTALKEMKFHSRTRKNSVDLETPFHSGGNTPVMRIKIALFKSDKSIRSIRLLNVWPADGDTNPCSSCCGFKYTNDKHPAERDYDAPFEDGFWDEFVVMENITDENYVTNVYMRFDAPVGVVRLTGLSFDTNFSITDTKRRWYGKDHGGIVVESRHHPKAGIGALISMQGLLTPKTGHIGYLECKFSALDGKVETLKKGTKLDLHIIREDAPTFDRIVVSQLPPSASKFGKSIFGTSRYGRKYDEEKHAEKKNAISFLSWNSESRRPSLGKELESKRSYRPKTDSSKVFVLWMCVLFGIYVCENSKICINIYIYIYI